MKHQLYVYAKLPRAGFANMLYPWARAIILRREYDAEMLAPEWVKLKRIGPWLRNEKYKRYYFNMLTNEGYIKGLKKEWVLLSSVKFPEEEVSAHKKGVCCVEGMGRYFNDFKDKSTYIKEELLKIAHPSILSSLSELPRNFIGVHIRRGDFATIGFARDESYYVRAIREAIRIKGNLPILVFSDAFERELQYLSVFDNLKIMPKASALHDLLALSASTAFIGTNRSTFSEWALFLGKMDSFWEDDDTSPDRNIFDYQTV